jgi:hypothetical protein
MEEQELKEVIQKQQVESCDERYVLEKVYWQRTVKMLVMIVSLLITLSGGIIAWGFKTSAEVTNNTQGRREIERRISDIESFYRIANENYSNVAKNQLEALQYSQRLSRKLDILIERAGAKYLEE